MKIKKEVGMWSIIVLLIFMNLFTGYIMIKQEKHIDEGERIIEEYQELGNALTISAQECSDSWKKTIIMWKQCEEDKT